MWEEGSVQARASGEAGDGGALAAMCSRSSRLPAHLHDLDRLVDAALFECIGLHRCREPLKRKGLVAVRETARRTALRAPCTSVAYVSFRVYTYIALASKRATGRWHKNTELAGGKREAPFEQTAQKTCPHVDIIAATDAWSDPR